MVRLKSGGVECRHVVIYRERETKTSRNKKRKDAL